MTESYPAKTTLTYDGFADIECTVDRISPLDGNSGETVVHIETNGHIYAYLHHKLFKDKESSDFSVRLIGESEHENLAALFRDVADILDPRSRNE